MALPVTAGKTKIARIKIHDTRMMRLMEVPLRSGTQPKGWRSAGCQSRHHVHPVPQAGLRATDEALKQPASRVETTYHKADDTIQHVLDLLAA